MALELTGDDLARYREIHAHRFDRKLAEKGHHRTSGIREIRTQELSCDVPVPASQWCPQNFRLSGFSR